MCLEIVFPSIHHSGDIVVAAVVGQILLPQVQLFCPVDTPHGTKTRGVAADGSAPSRLSTTRPNAMNDKRHCKYLVTVRDF